jgi:hypothetical protein
MQWFFGSKFIIITIKAKCNAKYNQYKLIYVH